MTWLNDGWRKIRETLDCFIRRLIYDWQQLFIKTNPSSFQFRYEIVFTFRSYVQFYEMLGILFHVCCCYRIPGLKSRLEFIIAGNSKQELEPTNPLKSQSREKKKCMCAYCSIHFFCYIVRPQSKKWYWVLSSRVFQHLERQSSQIGHRSAWSSPSLRFSSQATLGCIK